MTCQNMIPIDNMGRKECGMTGNPCIAIAGGECCPYLEDEECDYHD